MTKDKGYPIILNFERYSVSLTLKLDSDLEEAYLKFPEFYNSQIKNGLELSIKKMFEESESNEFKKEIKRTMMDFGIK